MSIGQIEAIGLNVMQIKSLGLIQKTIMTKWVLTSTLSKLGLEDREAENLAAVGCAARRK